LFPLGQKGSRGYQGYSGSKGSQGVVGTIGSKGQKGEIGLPGQKGQKGGLASIIGGTTYTRWGRNTCPTGATLIYSGRIGSTANNIKGGASNYICLPSNPTYYSFYHTIYNRNYVYGTRIDGESSYNQVSCAVCHRSSKHTTIMIPARTGCPNGWTEEYDGFLMSEHTSLHRSMFICVSLTSEREPGSSTGSVGTLYKVEMNCASTNFCPPYSSTQYQLACVVCSK